MSQSESHPAPPPPCFHLAPVGVSAGFSAPDSPLPARCSLRSLRPLIADRRTGADILAPSIGNLHGSYRFLPGGPAFDWSILEDLQARFGSAPGGPYLCMHGTDELSDAFFRRIVACGVSKINVNSWLREPYVRALADGLQRKSLPDAIDDAHDAMVREAERFCDLLGSTGKA